MAFVKDITKLLWCLYLITLFFKKKIGLYIVLELIYLLFIKLCLCTFTKQLRLFLYIVLIHSLHCSLTLRFSYKRLIKLASLIWCSKSCMHSCWCVLMALSYRSYYKCTTANCPVKKHVRGKGSVRFKIRDYHLWG